MAEKEENLAILTEIIQDDKKSHNEIGEIQQKKDEIKNKHKEITDIFKEVKILQERISEAYGKIYDIKNSDGVDSSQALMDIQDAQNKAKTMQESYNGFYDTKDSQGNITQGIVTKLKEACKQIEENKDDIADFKAFYNKIFNGIKNEKDEIIIPALADFLEIQKVELERLIEGATSIGLAKAYADEKKEIQKSIKWWNCIFVISIILFIVISVIYFNTSWKDDFTSLSFLRTLPFLFFGGFFTYYSTKQIAEYKQLASEYAHKETLNTTYIKYKEQVAQINNNEELTKQLLKIMLDSAEFNPSKVLNNKGEIPSLTILEKIADMLPLDKLKKFKEYITNKSKTD